MTDNQMLRGACHCGNISFEYACPVVVTDLPARACGCDFCSKHGARYTSHPRATLVAQVSDASRVLHYRFGTETAEFFICAKCGILVFATSEIDGRLYAVVNVNAFDGLDHKAFAVVHTSFDGETTDARLERRRRTWASRVLVGGEQ